jgi:hypothetical protein
MPPPPEWYWQPVEFDLFHPPKTIELPFSEFSLIRIEGASRVWDDLGEPGKQRLTRDGIVVVSGQEPAVQMGAFYTKLREQRVPYVVTLDALSYALHVAFERALAELDETMLAPALSAFLSKLEIHLEQERKGAGVELGEAIDFARALVSVARALVTPARPFSAPVDTASKLSLEWMSLVHDEMELVHAHAGPAISPLLGVSVDYRNFAAPLGAAHADAFVALTWLSSIPLSFAARTEIPGASVSVGTARRHTRAAMALARHTLREVDPEAAALWSRISRALTFVWGESDDVNATDLANLGATLGIALEDASQVSNVVNVDRLRHLAVATRPPRLYDGSGAPALRAGAAFRMFGGHASLDSLALAGFASAKRALPSALDLAAWLGAAQGRSAVHDEAADAFDGYDAALADAQRLHPTDSGALRASVYGTLLETWMAWLRPSSDVPRPFASVAAQRAAMDSALAAWTYARHDGAPFTRSKPPPMARATELEVQGAALPAYVEQAPDVLARLVAAAAQMKRGFSAVGGLPPKSVAMTSLAEVEDILRVALRIAVREANDEPLTPPDASALAVLPARLTRLEQTCGAEVPVTVRLAVDNAAGRSLWGTTGGVEPAVMVVREPGTGRLVLAVGAHVGYEDRIERHADSDDVSDVRQRSRVRSESAERTKRLSSGYAASFRLAR